MEQIGYDEAGHAIAALATFGHVYRIALNWNGSGVTLFSGGWTLIIASAGYLSTILYGSGLLLLLRRARNARAVAICTAALLLLITVLFGGNLLAWLTGLVFGVGCFLLAVKAKPKVMHFVMSFLAVQCVLNALYDLRTLLFLSAFDSNIHTDAQLMASATVRSRIVSRTSSMVARSRLPMRPPSSMAARSITPSSSVVAGGSR